jgi:hypothetical protein
MSEHRLNEIVIERPRGGMRISLRKQAGFKKQLNKLTQEATEDGLLCPYLIKPRNKSKWLSDHLGPLRRFLRSKVGQPWNDVYSQLSQCLDRSTVTGQHVLDHLWDYVERHVELIDDIPHRQPYSGRAGPLISCYRSQFYVHPETGILTAVALEPRKQKKKPYSTECLAIDKYHQYRKLNDIWYLITFADLLPSSISPVFDVLEGELDPRAYAYRYLKLYAVKKQQCNKKEIQFILNQLSEP